MAASAVTRNRQGISPGTSAAQTISVNQPNVPQFVVGTGSLQPVREVKISPEVSGEIVALPVKEGQQIKKGDLLMRIKPDFYIANRDQAEGNYKSALAGLDIARARLQ